MNKKDLIDLHTKDCLHRKVIGNVLWMIKEGSQSPYIECLIIKRFHNKKWGALKRYKEQDELQYINCPKAYLDRAPQVSYEWRQRVLKYHEIRSMSPILMKKEIRAKFKEAQEEDKLVRVILEPKKGYTITGPELFIREIDHPEYGIVAEGKNRLYYFDRIAFRRIKQIDIVDSSLSAFRKRYYTEEQKC